MESSQRRADPWAVAALTALAVLTRVPFAGNSTGEPDSALFPLGLWRWLTAGPSAGRIYDRQFSPGYYWLGARLAILFHASWIHFPALLTRLSIGATVLTAPLVYGLARHWMPPRPAFWASLLWLLAPAVWWIGIEPHPQAPATAMLLAALFAAWQLRAASGPRRQLAAAAFLAALSAALLLRSDGLFLLAVPFVPLPRRPLRRADALCLLALEATAIEIWLLLRRALLPPAPEPGVVQRILGYWGGLSWPHQLLPFLTAGGLLAGLLAAGGWGHLRAPERRRWLLLLLAWSAPAGLFWLLVRGNNVRHVALLLLPWLWAGMAGWHRRGPRAAALIACAALLGDALLPASSNLTLYPSGNVPASVRLLRGKQDEVARLAASLLRQPTARVCYAGSYTTPYVLWQTLLALQRQGIQPALAVSRTGVRTWIASGNGRPVLEIQEVYNAGQFRGLPACPRRISLEYQPDGQRLHFLGDETFYRALR